ncbi:MAG: Asp-tRNA(Asn)/Glu-tRNA(Gln) amidotransferase subunit GatC [Paenibacillus sp.]|uniref:Asp-tRNA(Asn)/Glu-tRNA(Gln) amidotransferase subunit GatC n=1 Tax=Paenibacillus aquistagni TaxID=1852522 RepID=UPI000B50D2C7|nr:Asp-tRNA(Asn)/Glu-tRNA(Gln) amidotransferase subunit GatC [Paenibacillus aquistagni]MBR2567763.1 Asp-tRNA(Asn)/Glu-tRNA(Gln) amidotransferase subunit GatC [Paenibacillus sp.]NMM53204.1 Asp-tRNA(Asn)/Glu-tRNA(Gln) amidotransferase subunit GatC [Paenibacillus aquistagni]
MSIRLENVEHVARLARLELASEEKDRFLGQLNAILNYADKLNELNTDDVAPTTHVLPIHNVLRDDEVRESLTIEQVMKNAPEEEEGQFLVPAVLE